MGLLGGVDPAKYVAIKGPGSLGRWPRSLGVVPAPCTHTNIDTHTSPGSAPIKRSKPGYTQMSPLITRSLMTSAVHTHASLYTRTPFSLRLSHTHVFTSSFRHKNCWQQFGFCRTARTYSNTAEEWSCIRYSSSSHSNLYGFLPHNTNEDMVDPIVSTYFVFHRRNKQDTDFEVIFHLFKKSICKTYELEMLALDWPLMISPPSDCDCRKLNKTLGWNAQSTQAWTACCRTVFTGPGPKWSGSCSNSLRSRWGPDSPCLFTYTQTKKMEDRGSGEVCS